MQSLLLFNKNKRKLILLNKDFKLPYFFNENSWILNYRQAQTCVQLFTYNGIYIVSQNE
jgi:hypothetical protein